MPPSKVKKKKQGSLINKDVDLFVGQRIKAFRLSKGLSQAQLIKKAGINMTQQMYSRYESGDARMYFSIIYALCSGLGISMFDLLDGKDDLKKLRKVSNSISKNVAKNSLQKAIESLDAIEKQCTKEKEQLISSFEAL
jgi:transcriptional regulator with XRE-family HTH domain